RKELNKAIKKAKEREKKNALGEKKYTKEIDKKINIQRNKKVTVTIISDICRGKENIAELKFNRDTAEILYKSANERIQATKLELRIIENQMEAERRGV